MATALSLEDFRQHHEFFVGLDSDGCVFDSMEIKHKRCFAPEFVRHWSLEPAAGHAEQVWQFVNLYSVDRGMNRFPALIRSFELLSEWPEAMERGLEVPDLRPLRDFVASGAPQSNPSLQKAASETGDALLAAVLDWSKAVNAAVAEIVRGVPPFPDVVGCLERVTTQADLAVVSGTPTEALRREWEEHRIDHYPQAIAGQELGTKSHHLRVMTGEGKRYGPGRMLMIGDAPGDLKAARAVGALFYPICPGHEEESWQRLREEALSRFFSGTFSTAYQAERIVEFEKLLPSRPPWKG
jgi:phosphoglycolate phosphatase-like HAD superfamily hydrolase